MLPRTTSTVNTKLGSCSTPELEWLAMLTLVKYWFITFVYKILSMICCITFRLATSWRRWNGALLRRCWLSRCWRSRRSRRTSSCGGLNRFVSFRWAPPNRTTWISCGAFSSRTEFTSFRRAPPNRTAWINCWGTFCSCGLFSSFGWAPPTGTAWIRFSCRWCRRCDSGTWS